jgi:hypothetical protein
MRAISFRRARLKNLVIAGAVVFAVLQVVRPTIPIKPETAELRAPPEIMARTRDL